MTLTLTISPIGSRPHRIACMSCRLYFSTGVCPVWKLWDFAQPRRTEGSDAMLCRLLLGARIVGHVKPWNSDRTGGSRDLHHTVQHDRRSFDDLTIGSLTFGLKAD